MPDREPILGDAEPESPATRVKAKGQALRIDEFLRTRRFPSEYRGAFCDAAGHDLEPVAALTYLHLEKAKGRVVIPCSVDCGKPCRFAMDGCIGFDYTGGGCPGYEPPGE